MAEEKEEEVNGEGDLKVAEVVEVVLRTEEVVAVVLKTEEVVVADLKAGEEEVMDLEGEGGEEQGIVTKVLVWEEAEAEAEAMTGAAHPQSDGQ